MIKSVCVAVLSLAVATGIAWSHQGAMAHHTGMSHHAGKTITVKGEVVDLACYMSHLERGAKHAECGKMCVALGMPMGILTSKGMVYLLLEDHDSMKGRKAYSQAKELVAATVTASGEFYQHGGLRAIAVDRVSKD
ncbi:MAG: hypothetical protein KGO96_02665 [Elusimicrobia bacterium]|nr:hypothetical protein [Elusimicrobiota bacterium]